MAPSGVSVLFQYGTGEKGHGLSEDGKRKLHQPRGLRLASDGSLLVADFGNHSVFKFAPGDDKGCVVAGEAGKILPTVDPLKDIDRPLGPAEGEGHLLKRPVDACEDAQGGILVLDTEACRLQRFPRGRGERAKTLVPEVEQRSNNTPEAVKYPRAMHASPDGALIICDTWSHRLLRYTAAGGTPELLAGKPNSCGATAEKLAFPSGFVFDDEGGLLVADTNNHRVQRFAPGQVEGTTVAGSAEGIAGSGPGELHMPTGICIDPTNGSIVVADRANSRVLRFPAGSRAGQTAEILAGPEVLKAPWGVCVDADGALYVSDERKASVFKLEVAAASQGAPVEKAAAEAPAVAEAAAERETKMSSAEDANELD